MGGVTALQVIISNFFKPMKAPEPTVFNVEGSSTSLTLLQPMKAKSPMRVMPSWTMTTSILLQKRKARGMTCVTS